jgi:hypothetical protein
MRRTLTTAFAAALVSLLIPAAALAAGSVLRVGTYNGIKGQYTTIQAAVNAAKPGDWILIGPGDYKTTTAKVVKGEELPAGVLITTPNIYLRGMNRNTVIVDGTKPGSAPCSSKASAQNTGPAGNGGHLGLNGILVWNADNVWIQNLTACNFLTGAGDSGNEIWWDAYRLGTKGQGKGMVGSYLNATSTYFDPKNPATAAAYGIFSSRWSGGTWTNTYASNFNDSGYYIGACQQSCDQTIDDGWAEYNALGYSGSNSGGTLIVKDSQFDNNEDGFSTNSQNGDNPPPQNGDCPNGGTSPITHTNSCWVFEDNYVHDNNDPNVPALGTAAQGPVGTGISIAGGRNDTVMHNRFVDNDAWGVILLPYLDSGKPCTGGTYGGTFGATSCLFSGYGVNLLDNTFSDNGSYGHPSNGDVGWVSLETDPIDCFAGNTQSSGSLSPDLVTLQTTYPTCTGTDVAPSSSNSSFLGEVLCDSQVEVNPGTPATCPTGQYPRRVLSKVVMHKLPTKQLPTMPNPCAGVPKNPWCPKNKASGKDWS